MLITLDRVKCDFQLAFRGIKKRPHFAVAIIGILGTAMGAFMSMYSFLDWSVLRTLPYPESKDILALGIAEGDSRPKVSLQEFDLLNTSPEILDQLTLSRWESMTLTSADETSRLDGNIVSLGFGLLFDLKTLKGRSLSEGDYSGSASPVALISEHLWRTRFGSNKAIIGSQLVLNLRSYSVIGIVSNEFHDPEEYRRHVPIDIWLPMVRSTERLPTARLYYLTAHRRYKATLSQVRDLFSIKIHADRLNSRSNVSVATLQDSLVAASTKSQLVLLTLSVGLVLIVACANVSGLILARTLELRSEIALRLALGASRFRIIQRQIAEVTVLVACSGALSIVVAVTVISLVRRFIPVELPHLQEIQIDSRAILCFMCTLCFTTILCAALPSVQSIRTDINQEVRGSAQGITLNRNPRRFSAIAVILQFALTFTLISGAGILVRSFWNLIRVNPGFSTDHILTMQIRLPFVKYRDPMKRSGFYSAALSELSSLPNVRLSSVSAALPLGGSGFSDQFIAQDHPAASNDRRPVATLMIVSPQYFSILNVHLLAGRVFNEDDVAQTKNVVLISQKMARENWPDTEAIGKRLRFGSVDDTNPNWLTVVGIVSDVSNSTLERADDATVYELYTTLPPPYGYLILKTKVDPLAAVGSVRKVIRGLDKDVPLDRVSTLDSILSSSIAAPRFRAFLASSFAGLALLLSTIGIYASFSYAVAMRQHEIGIRMMLGSPRLTVFRSVLASALTQVASGLVLGFVGTYIFTRALRFFLFAVKPLDMLVLVSAVFALAFVGAAAVVHPAWRAATVDPLRTLREN